MKVRTLALCLLVLYLLPLFGTLADGGPLSEFETVLESCSFFGTGEDRKIGNDLENRKKEKMIEDRKKENMSINHLKFTSPTCLYK